MMSNIRYKIQKVIQKVLKEQPITRLDDKRLILEVWKEEGLHLGKMREAYFLANCSPPESITRARRKMQEDGFYKPSEESQRLKGVEERKLRSYFSGQEELYYGVERTDTYLDYKNKSY